MLFECSAFRWIVTLRWIQVYREIWLWKYSSSCFYGNSSVFHGTIMIKRSRELTAIRRRGWGWSECVICVMFNGVTYLSISSPDRAVCSSSEISSLSNGSFSMTISPPPFLNMKNKDDFLPLCFSLLYTDCVVNSLALNESALCCAVVYENDQIDILTDDDGDKSQAAFRLSFRNVLQLSLHHDSESARPSCHLTEGIWRQIEKKWERELSWI